MMRRAVLFSLLLCLGLVGGNPMAGARSEELVHPQGWNAYRERFVGADGRVIDDANGNISHSEGQGYGLLLSYLANRPADFDLIWSFTRTELMLRDDGLSAWKWDPAAKPHVTDVNNASDGDMLIAYALALAGADWERPDLTRSATELTAALAKATVVSSGDRNLLLPAAQGFDGADRPDAPVVNLSYWIFEAFPTLARLAPQTPWQAVSDYGLALLAQARLGPRKLPPDWISLKTRPRPAEGFPAEFGYNALRIPLYLMRAGYTDRALLEPFRAAMAGRDGAVELVDIETGEVRERLTDAGYRIIPALISCVLDGSKLDPALTSFAPTQYYPSTLHLLGLSFVASQHPECLP